MGPLDGFPLVDGMFAPHFDDVQRDWILDETALIVPPLDPRIKRYATLNKTALHSLFYLTRG